MKQKNRRSKEKGKFMKKDIKFYIALIISIVVLLMMTNYQVSLLGIENSKNKLLIIIMAILISATVVLISICFYKEKKLTEMQVFKVLVPIIFVLFFICMPIFQNHDEDSHWIRIYDMAQGNFLTSTEYGSIFAENSTNYPAAKMPKSILKIIEMQYSTNHSIRDLMDVRLNPEEEIYVAMPTTAIYSPVQYLPQAIGVYVTKLITDRPIVMAYAARLMNMVTCYILLYFAMKFIPFGKKILLLVMSIPIAVEGLTSLSPDGITISVSLLLISYILHLIYDEKVSRITWKNKLVLTVLGIVVALCKIVYLPLVGLVLLLPKEKFKSREEQILTIGAIILVAVAVNLRMAWNCEHLLSRV